MSNDHMQWCPCVSFGSALGQPEAGEPHEINAGRSLYENTPHAYSPGHWEVFKALLLCKWKIVRMQKMHVEFAALPMLLAVGMCVKC